MIARVATSISAVILISVVTYAGYLFREVLLASPVMISVVCAMTSILLVTIFRHGRIPQYHCIARQTRKLFP